MRHDPSFAPRLYEHNVIRMEMQVKKEHIKYKRRLGIESTYDTWINYKMEREYLQQLYKMIPKGDFFKKTEVIARIDNDTAIGSTLKNHLREFIEIVHTGGLDAAKEKYSNNTYHHYLDYFAEIGMSPITIPDDKGIDFIKSPFIIP
jgi:hypothetical protein